MPKFTPAFVSGPTGWEATHLNDPAAPVLAGRLAKAFEHARHVFEGASEAEQEEFWAWLWEE